MKRTALMTLCMAMVMATVANAACYKCVNSNGIVSFTDNPPQDAKCEWLSTCSSTYSEELERENEARDANSRSQWAEEEARKSELKQQELEARKLELKQKELELKQRELDEKADQARKEYITEEYNTVIHHPKISKRNHDDRHPSSSKSKSKEQEPDPKARDDFKPKKDVAGQAGSHPSTKITNEKHAEKVQQNPSSQPPSLEKQLK
jgi:hypothetical protein